MVKAMYRDRLTRLRRAPYSYLVAVGLTLLAFGIRWGLDPVLGDRSPLLAFAFAVALSALYCGTAPALVALLLSIALGLYFFFPPSHTFTMQSPREVVQLLLYVVPMIIIIAIGAKAEKDRLFRERANDRFRLLTEQAREYGVITMDLHGRIITWSPGAEQLFGYTAQEAVGKTAHLMFLEEDEQAHAPEQELQQAIRHGHAPCERWLARRDGSRFYGVGMLVALRDQSGNIRELIKIVRDASHIKQRETHLEQAAQRSARQLWETTEQVDAFTYTVAHDLRAPLRALDGYANILDHDYGERLDADGRDYLRRISAAAQRMDELVSDLLDFWSLVRQTPALVPVDVNAVLDRVLSELKADIRLSRAEVVRDTPLPLVLGDPEYLRKSFCHLISNALKFAPAAGQRPRIEIAAAPAGEWVRISVRDNGPGIAAEYHSRIFKVFERLDTSKPGTGIGLSIVSKCAEQLGGRVGVDSAPGQGSRFWIELRKAGSEVKA